MMSQQLHIYILLILITITIHVLKGQVQSCKPVTETGCDFRRHLCEWKAEGTIEIFNTKDYLLFELPLSTSTRTGNITSPLICETRNMQITLSFEYYNSGNNTTVFELAVVLKWHISKGNWNYNVLWSTNQSTAVEDWKKSNFDTDSLLQSFYITFQVKSPTSGYSTLKSGLKNFKIRFKSNARESEESNVGLNAGPWAAIVIICVAAIFAGIIICIVVRQKRRGEHGIKASRKEKSDDNLKKSAQEKDFTEALQDVNFDGDDKSANQSREVSLSVYYSSINNVDVVCQVQATPSEYVEVTGNQHGNTQAFSAHIQERKRPSTNTKQETTSTSRQEVKTSHSDYNVLDLNRKPWGKDADVNGVPALEKSVYNHLHPGNAPSLGSEEYAKLDSDNIKVGFSDTVPSSLNCNVQDVYNHLTSIS